MKPKRFKLLRCKCGAMNELSKVRYLHDDFKISTATVECTATGHKRNYVRGDK